MNLEVLPSTHPIPDAIRPKRERTLHNLINEFIDVGLAGTAVRTRSAYRVSLTHFERFCGHESPTVETWGRFMKWLIVDSGFSAARIQSVRTQVKAFFQWLEDAGYIERTPCRGKFRLPKVQWEPQPNFSKEDYEKLKAACTGRNAHQRYQLVVASWNLGASMADVCQLKWTNVDMTSANMFVHVPRQKVAAHNCVQHVPLMPDSDLYALLVERREWRDRIQAAVDAGKIRPDELVFEREYVFPELARVYQRAANLVVQMFEYAVKRAGLPTKGVLRRTHRHMRHSFCSDLMNGGMDPLTACAITGHKNVTMLKHYVKHDPAKIAERFKAAMDARRKE